MLRKEYSDKKINDDEFSKFLLLLIDEAKVATAAEIGRAIGKTYGKNCINEATYVKGYKTYANRKYSGDPRQCPDWKQTFILRYLEGKMIDADGRLLDEFRKWEKDIEKFYILNTDANSGLEHARECFSRMNNSEKGYILKYYFKNEKFHSSDIWMLEHVTKAENADFYKKYNVKFDITLLSPDNFTGWREENYRQICACMYMSLYPYSEYFEEEKDDYVYMQEFEKCLKDYKPSGYRFTWLAPLFLKMTREKWFFMAQYLLNKLDEGDPYRNPLLGGQGEPELLWNGTVIKPKSRRLNRFAEVVNEAARKNREKQKESHK